MFTQFFGNYLINENLVSHEQLVEGLKQKANTHLKFGVLAMNSGYMTAHQVNKVHTLQTKTNKRIGDIAFELGYITQAQIKEVLSTQKSGYLLLGQALVDKGYLTNEQFEEAINNYRNNYKLTDDDITKAKQDKIQQMIERLVGDSENKYKEYCIDYIGLLINNLVRFVGDDFIVLDPEHQILNDDSVYITTQNIMGDFATQTIVSGNSDIMIDFVNRFIKETHNEVDDFIEAGSCDFLNLHNGLFTVNISNEKDVELKLTPPEFRKGLNEEELKDKIMVIPICYPKGTLKFTITL